MPKHRQYADGSDVRPVVMCHPDEDLAVQSEKAACDINNVVNSYLRTGQMPAFDLQAYRDVSHGLTLHEAAIVSQELQEHFLDRIPATVREKFGNDPVRFVEEIVLDEHLEDAVSLGLRERPVPEVPNEVPANPPA